MTRPAGDPEYASTTLPPGSWRPLASRLRRLLHPISSFFALEAASGLLLLSTTAVALIWANSSGAASYHALWHAPLGVQVGAWSFQRSLDWLLVAD
jgi:Na+:H+ antiporter, NhaA family